MHNRLRSMVVPSLGVLLALALSIAAVSPLSAQAASSQPDLSDAEVAHVAVTANRIDVEMAQFAERRLQNADVRAFAATMIRDHTAVNGRASALATRLGVTPAANAVSASLSADAGAARRQLEALQGSAFDRAYVEREVAYHQAVLDALDGLLIPTTTNDELKALLTDVRPAIAAHLAHAKQLRASLADRE